MKKLFFVLLFSLIPLNVYSEDFILPVVTEVSSEDEEIKDLVWNRFVKENFVILSIDEQQGSWLHKNIDSINDWCTTRWGFPKVQFSKECRIFCVPNKSLLSKLFNLNESRVEIRKKDGEINISVLWLVLEEPTPSSVAQYLTRASFAEYEEQEEVKLPFWFLRSAEILNSPLNNVRTNLKNTISELNVKSVFETKIEDYETLAKDKKDLFDQQALFLNLMLRKELGELKLHSLLRLEEKNDLENVLKFVYGYKNLKEFESKFSLFYKDLSKAVSLEKVPDSYLLINSKGK
jgi:hypothetical protein